MPKSSNILSPSLKHLPEVKAFLVECGVPQYYETFINEGFDRISTIMDVTENDLTEMKMKLGHRRLLQRFIATCKGVPTSQSLLHLKRQHEDFGEHHGVFSPQSPLSSCSPPRHRSFLPEILQTIASSTEEEDDFNITSLRDSASAQNEEGSGKRQYRRHPKADLNAPIKPASGYVMFANALREEIKDQKMSFADIAKVVGERWKQINPGEKFYWEDAAAKAKQEYLRQTTEYQKTESYELYQQYLRQFEQQGSDRALGRPRRRRGLRTQRGESPSMAAMGASSGNESLLSQREASCTTPEGRNWEGLVRTSSGDGLVRTSSGDSVINNQQQPYRPLSPMAQRQSSIRSIEKRPQTNRNTSQASSISNASTASSEGATVPSLEREAN